MKNGAVMKAAKASQASQSAARRVVEMCEIRL